SSTGNNGSAFAGLTGNTFFYNLTLASAMFGGRFFMIVPAMAIAGSLAGQKSIPPSAGTFPPTGGLFVCLVLCLILIIGGFDLLPGTRARADRRAARDDGRHAVLSNRFGVTSMETVKTQKRNPAATMLDPKIVMPAIRASFTKLDPRLMMKNPVMFVVEIVAA